MGACSRFFSQQYQVIFDPLKKTTPTTHFQNLIILFTSNSKKEEAFFQKLCCFMT